MLNVVIIYFMVKWCKMILNVNILFVECLSILFIWYGSGGFVSYDSLVSWLRFILWGRNRIMFGDIVCVVWKSLNFKIKKIL